MNFLSKVFIQEENIRNGLTYLLFDGLNKGKILLSGKQLLNDYSEYSDFQEIISCDNKIFTIPYSERGHGNLESRISDKGMSHFLDIFTTQIFRFIDGNKQHIRDKNKIRSIDLKKIVNFENKNNKRYFSILSKNLFFNIFSLYEKKQINEKEYKTLLKKYGIMLFFYEISFNYEKLGANFFFKNAEKSILERNLHFYKGTFQIFIKSREMLYEMIDDLVKYGIFSNEECEKIRVLFSKFDKMFFNTKVEDFQGFRYGSGRLLFVEKENFEKKLKENEKRENISSLMNLSNTTYFNFVFEDLLFGMFGDTNKKGYIHVFNKKFFDKLGLYKDKEYLGDITYILTEIYKSFKNKKEIYKRGYEQYFEEIFNVSKKERGTLKKEDKFQGYLYNFFLRSDDIFFLKYGEIEIKNFSKEIRNYVNILTKIKQECLELACESFINFSNDKDIIFIKNSIIKRRYSEFVGFGSAYSSNNIDESLEEGTFLLNHLNKRTGYKELYNIINFYSSMYKFFNQKELLYKLCSFEEDYLFMKCFQKYKDTIIGLLLRKRTIGDEEVSRRKYNRYNGITKERYQEGKTKLLKFISIYDELSKTYFMKKGGDYNLEEFKKEVENIYTEIFNQIEKNKKIYNENLNLKQ